MKENGEELLLEIRGALVELREDSKTEGIESRAILAEIRELGVRFETLSEDVREVDGEVKAIAHKIWRGNGGSSIMEWMARQEARLAAALERLVKVEDIVPLPAGGGVPAGGKGGEEAKKKETPGLRFQIIVGSAILAATLAVLAFALGQDNVKLLLEVWR